MDRGIVTKLAGQHPAVPAQHQLDAQDLAERVYKRAVAMLEAHGNVLSVDHAAGTRAIAEGLAFGIYSEDTFRLAFPLETGQGKTSCAIALLAELEGTEVSALICAEQIHQLHQ